MKNNKGLSLIELIVVLAIISVLLSAGIIGMQYISTKPAKQLAYNLKTIIQNGRTTALAKDVGDYKLVIKYDASTNSYVAEETIEGATITKNLGGNMVSVKYTLEGGTEQIMDTTNPITIIFDRATGGLSSTGDMVKTIEINKLSKRYIITIYKLTGKVILKE